MLVKVGTRGSRLSLVQAELAIRRLQEKMPDVQVQKEIIHTSGDLDQETPLYSLGQKGIFEREIDQALVEGRIDIAVHSLKDLPVFDQTSNLSLQAVLDRAPTSDVLVSRTGRKLEDLPAGSRVGTSSLLRSSQLKRVRSDLNPISIRGNVETRIQKVDRGEYDAVILAEAGLFRLGIHHRITERLSLEDFLPSPGQGIIAIVARADDERTRVYCRLMDHPITRIEAEAEREIVRLLEGGCKAPIGALATARNGKLELVAHVLSVDGKERVEARREGPLTNPRQLALEVAAELLDRGARRLEDEWRKVYA